MIAKKTIVSGFAFLFFVVCTAQKTLNVNQDRLEKTIHELAEFGQKPNGEGNRVAFSDGDIEGRKFTIEIMREAGLEVSVDFAGNIIGKRAGKNSKLSPIAFGSHIDMVPDGGNYDGCVGSMASIEVVRILKENNIHKKNYLKENINSKYQKDFL